MLKRWSTDEVTLLKQHYPSATISELITLIGRTTTAIYTKARHLGLKKDAEFQQNESGGRFQDRPVGFEFVNSQGYLMRKINNDYPVRDRYQYAHILEWEKYYGPVPAGYLVCFKNGDKKIICIENLELITKAEHIRKYSFSQYPPELKQAITACKKLQRAIEEKEDEGR